MAREKPSQPKVKPPEVSAIPRSRNESTIYTNSDRRMEQAREIRNDYYWRVTRPALLERLGISSIPEKSEEEIIASMEFLERYDIK